MCFMHSNTFRCHISGGSVLKIAYLSKEDWENVSEKISFLKKSIQKKSHLLFWKIVVSFIFRGNQTAKIPVKFG